ncbi:glycoside hydrolase family 18 protein [Aplosporella prunicola CBS 121167]|uniref:chitinase n=1 Tax=Aplosporella prunicola CBS 121167 TaxID=1176127 RepID=A0A6A6BTT1_9PEZI|nr:glycoside hydrolase family 18 protein [Aplosporella prunicola CBS 121167]KAF2146675.1 glycoside hydrolase family 18 protein [Aplosporella prunicola CBS 121167]
MFFNAVYYPNWHVYKQLPPSALNFDVISHAFYAFAHVKHDGTVHLSDEWADAQIDVDGTTGCLRSFAQLKEKYTILRVVLSVGGGGKGSEPFAHVAHHEETRHTFARTAKDLVTEYGLDGIDIDWEHPNSTQQGHDYVSLLQTLRTYMPAPIYTLTTALPAGQWALQHIPLARAAQHLDLINVMTYDFSGPWVPTAEHHAQLYAPRKPHSAHCGVSCQSAVSYFTSQGVSPKKLLLGVPAYGRSFLGAKGPGHSYRGHAGDEGTFLYKDLPRPGTKERVDDKTGAAYCVGGDGGFVSYDNAATVRQKAGFVKAEGLAGMFYWTGTGDDMDDKERSLVFNGYVGMHN